MGLNYNSSSIIGSGIDQEVLQQLERRRKVFASHHKTSDEVGYTQANSVFVRLMSTVNEVDPFDGSQDETLAATHILQAGQLDEYGAVDNFTLRGGMKPDKYPPPTPAYEDDTERGTIPMPGITSVTVTPKNSFGTVRLGKINFRVNSANQLSVIEKLYMRPGYEVLLEWGHSRWIDSDNEIQTKAIRISNKYFFGNGSTDAIMKSAYKVKKMADYNYDFMYGRVSNFSWSLSNGIYDCSIDLISEGNLIESVKAASTINSIDSNDDKSNQAKYTSRLHYYLDAVLNTPKLQNFSITKSIEKKLRSKNRNHALLSRVENFQFQQLDNGDGYPDGSNFNDATEFRYPHYIMANDKKGSDGGESHRFMTMAEFLALVNEVFMPKDEFEKSVIRFYTGDFEQAAGTPKTPFLTYGSHLALDMRVALLPKSANNNSPFVLTPSKSYNNYYGATNDILQIYINVRYLWDTVSEIIKTPDNSVKNVLTLVNSVLAGIQHTLGGINEFDIHFDEETRIYYVVDRKIVPAKDDIKNLESIIKISGIGTTVSDVKLASKNSPALATMVAVSATATHSDAGDELMNLQKWNQGLVNRHRNELRIAAKNQQKDIDEAPETAASLIKALKTFVKNSNARDWDEYKDAENPQSVVEIIDQEIESLREIHSSISSDKLQTEIRKKKTNPPGLIPLELSFTMKGISGLKIGQSFLLSDEFLLPEKYRGNVGFLITGISHNIDQNKWRTEVTTQMIVLQTFEKVVADVGDDDEEEEVAEVPEEITPAENPNPSQRQPVGTLTVGKDCTDLVKKFESFEANAYRDPGSGNQPMTIGYGTTVINGRAVKLGDVITEPVAARIMQEQLEQQYASSVRSFVKVPVTQYEFDALASFAYNVGVGNLKSSTLLRKLNSKDYVGAGNEFPRWNKAGGQVMRGLTRRRKAEQDLFFKDSPGNKAS